MTYQEFIEEKRNNPPSGYYFERHHIKPKCIGGSDNDDNLISLSYEDHWMAHKLLAEENPDVKELQFAFNSCGSLEQFVAKKIKRIDKIIGSTHTLSEESKRKISEAKKGRKHSEETKRKISEATKGKVVSEETRKRMSQSQMGHSLSEDSRKSISEKAKLRFSNKENHPMSGKHFSEEAKKKMSEARKRYWEFKKGA